MGLQHCHRAPPGLCCGTVKPTRASLRLPARSSVGGLGGAAKLLCPGLFVCVAGLSSPTMLFGRVAGAQQAEPAKPVVVQPGAPGKPSKTLPPSTKGTLPPRSAADVQFMQGMILHHAQAVEMTALIASHSDNQELQSLAGRISRSQTDEIKFMKRWLVARGEPVEMARSSGAGSSSSDPAAAMHDMDMSGMSHGLMPGMLTPEQMEALRKAKGAEF